MTPPYDDGSPPATSPPRGPRGPIDGSRVLQSDPADNRRRSLQPVSPPTRTKRRRPNPRSPNQWTSRPVQGSDVYRPGERKGLGLMDSYRPPKSDPRPQGREESRPSSRQEPEPTSREDVRPSSYERGDIEIRPMGPRFPCSSPPPDAPRGPKAWNVWRKEKDEIYVDLNPAPAPALDTLSTPGLRRRENAILPSSLQNYVSISLRGIESSRPSEWKVELITALAEHLIQVKQHLRLDGPSTVEIVHGRTVCYIGLINSITSIAYKPYLLRACCEGIGLLQQYKMETSLNGTSSSSAMRFAYDLSLTWEEDKLEAQPDQPASDITLILSSVAIQPPKTSDDEKSGLPLDQTTSDREIVHPYHARPLGTTSEPGGAEASFGFLLSTKLDLSHKNSDSASSSSFLTASEISSTERSRRKCPNCQFEIFQSPTITCDLCHRHAHENCKSKSDTESYMWACLRCVKKLQKRGMLSAGRSPQPWSITHTPVPDSVHSASSNPGIPTARSTTPMSGKQVIDSFIARTKTGPPTNEPLLRDSRIKPRGNAFADAAKSQLQAPQCRSRPASFSSNRSASEAPMDISSDTDDFADSKIFTSTPRLDITRESLAASDSGNRESPDHAFRFLGPAGTANATPATRSDQIAELASMNPTPKTVNGFKDILNNLPNSEPSNANTIPSSKLPTMDLMTSQLPLVNTTPPRSSASHETPNNLFFSISTLSIKPTNKPSTSPISSIPREFPVSFKGWGKAFKKAGFDDPFVESKGRNDKLKYCNQISQGLNKFPWELIPRPPTRFSPELLKSLAHLERVLDRFGSVDDLVKMIAEHVSHQRMDVPSLSGPVTTTSGGVRVFIEEALARPPIYPEEQIPEPAIAMSQHEVPFNPTVENSLGPGSPSLHCENVATLSDRAQAPGILDPENRPNDDINDEPISSKSMGSSVVHLSSESGPSESHRIPSQPIQVVFLEDGKQIETEARVDSIRDVTEISRAGSWLSAIESRRTDSPLSVLSLSPEVPGEPRLRDEVEEEPASEQRGPTITLKLTGLTELAMLAPKNLQLRKSANLNPETSNKIVEFYEGADESTRTTSGNTNTPPNTSPFTYKELILLALYVDPQQRGAPLPRWIVNNVFDWVIQRFPTENTRLLSNNLSAQCSTHATNGLLVKETEENPTTKKKQTLYSANTAFKKFPSEESVKELHLRFQKAIGDRQAVFIANQKDANEGATTKKRKKKRRSHVDEEIPPPLKKARMSVPLQSAQKAARKQIRPSPAARKSLVSVRRAPSLPIKDSLRIVDDSELPGSLNQATGAETPITTSKSIRKPAIKSITIQEMASHSTPDHMPDPVEILIQQAQQPGALTAEDQELLDLLPTAGDDESSERWAEEKGRNVEVRDLFDTWPEYHPDNVIIDTEAKINEIRRRPNRREMMAMKLPIRLSKPPLKHRWSPISQAESNTDEDALLMNRQSPRKRNALGSRRSGNIDENVIPASAVDARLLSDPAEIVYKKVDFWEEALGLPKLLVPGFENGVNEKSGLVWEVPQSVRGRSRNWWKASLPS